MSRLRSYMPAFVKTIVWTWKHRNTRPNAARCPHDLVDFLETLDADSALLDLGCAAGNLRAALRLRGWNGHFIGVDVSPTAIGTAKKSESNNAEWHVGTIENFPIPSRKVSTVCLCESIYYVKPGDVPSLLERCRQSLVSPGGRIVIRIWEPQEHHEYITLLKGLGAQSNHPIYVLDT